jgi:hypothetical protein
MLGHSFAIGRWAGVSALVAALSLAAAASEIRVFRDSGGTSIVADDLGTIHTTQGAVVNERRIDVPGSSVVLVPWDEQDAEGGTTSHYAISLDGRGVQRVTATDYRLKLRYAEFDPLAGAPGVPAETVNAETRIHIVQFVTQPLDIYREQLAFLGATIHRFLPRHAYIVEMTPEVRDAVAGLPYVRWVGPYEPAYRLDDALLSGLVGDSALPPARYNIQVFERGARQQQQVGGFLSALGGTVDQITPEGFVMQATLNGAQLLEVARLDQVMFIDPWSAPEADMNLAREISGANYIESLGGLDGTGVRGEVMDGNVLDTHGDLQLHPVIFHGARGGDASHGTSTTGIVFGTGAGNASARGMLPDGQPIFASYSFLANRYTHTAELVRSPYRAVFQSNSWGSATTTAYTNDSAQMDDITFINDIVITQSQSNTGSQLSRPQAWAKNVVSVGGVFHRNTLSIVDDCWCGGASVGPAVDDRVKPDLTHFYDAIFTLASNGGYTANFGGTSGATPIVAGNFGLFFEMWHREVFPGHGGSNNVFNSRSHMTTAKAMLINTARQYAFNGTSADLGRYHQGWGMPDLRYMYDMANKMLIVDEDVVLTELQEQVYQVTVEPNEPLLKATLTWADPAGSPGSTMNRVNDLSLHAESPAGEGYWGNRRLYTGTASLPAAAPMDNDTVENIFVASPEAGVWTIKVVAHEINQDGHVETPEVDADFALIVSGVVAGGCAFDAADANCDGAIDAFDIEPFIDLLVNPSPTPCSPCAGDVNGDGTIDAFDIEPFIDCLLGGCP